MSEDRIAEIRARHEAGPIGMLPMQALAVAEDDRAFLLAEDERHRAQIERLRAALRECACACSSIRECVSEWARDGKCPHADARNALEGKP